MRRTQFALRIIIPDFRINEWPVPLRRRRVRPLYFGRIGHQPKQLPVIVEALPGKGWGSADTNAHRARPFTGQEGAWR